MLFGNIIFIKKTGGDGSKYPVTEKNIKIGRSEDCLIRIHNPQIDLEHCQLIVDDNGQAKLRNLSKSTILNGKPINQGDVTLCHGDIFKLGERSARWEYLPSSKYYQQVLSPPGRLIAVVMPQQRSIDEQATPGTSSSVISVSRSTRLGVHSMQNIQCRRSYHEGRVSENGSVKKVSRHSVTKNEKSVSNMAKFMSGRHSLQASKILFPSKVKQRKSTPGIMSSKSPKPRVVENTRKSTMASWSINIVSPPSSGRATQRKSTPIKKPLPIKSFDKLMKSGRKSAVKTPDLKTIVESSPREKEEAEEKYSRSTRSSSTSPINKNVNLAASDLSSTPGRKSILKPERLFNSEKKLTNIDSLKKSALLKRSSVVLKSLDKTPVKGVVKKLYENLSKSALSGDTFQESVKDVSNSLTKVFNSSIIEKSHSSDFIETPSKGRRVSNKASPRKSSAKDNTPSPKSLKKSRKSSKAVDSPLVDAQLLFTEEKTTPVNKRSPPKARSSRWSKKSTPSVSSVKKTSSERKSLAQTRDNASPGGVRRKLSPSISSAERAAKKLKTSSPKKPDKNKKAALLVLGKANRKHILSQNVKVLLKQKILKKAIKHSILPPTRKDEVATKISVKNVKKKSKKRATKRKKITTNKSTPREKKSSPKTSPKTPKATEESEVLKTSTPLLNSSKNQVSEGGSSRGKKSSERSPLSTSFVVQSTPSKNKVSNNDSSYSSKSPLKQGRKSESTNSSLSISKQSTAEFISAVDNLTNGSNIYLLNSNRRSSKRLSSKNDVSRPDFMELSPTALGLIPRNIEVFKTPKEGKRRSISLATPKVFRPSGIIKSASTSKVLNRKNVRFSSRIMASPLLLSTPNATPDFGTIKTPNISIDRFVSPLVGENLESFAENEMSKTFPVDELQRKSGTSPKIVKSRRSEPDRTKCVRKLLQSPSFKNDLSKSSPVPRASKKTKNQKSPKNDLTDLTGVRELLTTPRTQKSVETNKVVKGVAGGQRRKSVKEDLSIIEDVRKLFVLPKVQKSPQNDLSDVKGVLRLLRTPKIEKSPKNDLTDVKGVKKLLQTPKIQKTPKNDLTDVRGVKKLLKTPKVQKSPKNDLTDVRGVKKLLKTPKVQKSPKNDLTDVRGVKKLLKTPKVQKSPKNDLTDVRGVKKLLKTPKVQKSPKNDLTDVRGVRKLLKTPRVQKEPKNDLTDVAGVKQLMKSPRIQKSPKNELTDLVGVRQLLKSPREQKSPKNRLSDLRGVRQLLTSPKAQKSPKNELTDLIGVRKLMTSPRVQKSPKNDLKDVDGLEELFKSPRMQKSPRNDLSDLTGERELLVSPNPRKSVKNDLTEIVEVVGKKPKLSITPLMQKSPKNDLMDVSGVAQLFDLPLYQTTSMNEVGMVEETVKRQSERSFRSSFSDAAQMSQVTVTNSPLNLSEESIRGRNSNSKSRVRSFKSIRGRRTIYSTPKSPKNDLSDVEGVKELFSSYQSTSGLNMSLSDLCEFFDIPNSEVEVLKQQEVKETSRRRLREAAEERVVKTQKATTRRTTKETADIIEEVVPRATRSRKVTAGVEKKSNEEEESEPVPTRARGGRSIKRKAVELIDISTPTKKTSKLEEESGAAVARQRSTRSRSKATVQASEEKTETKRSRSKKPSTPAVSPPKLRRRRAATDDETTETVTKGSTRKITAKRTAQLKPEEETSASTTETDKKTLRKATTSKVQTKTVSKTRAKSTSKVQKGRSQSKSKEKLSDSTSEISPRSTRSGKATVSSRGKKTQVQTKTTSKKTVRSTSARKTASPAVKKSKTRK